MDTLIHNISTDYYFQLAESFSTDSLEFSQERNDQRAHLLFSSLFRTLSSGTNTPYQSQINHQARASSIMDAQQQVTGSRVLVVDSDKSWDIILGRAKVQACPVVVHFTADWCAPSKYMAGFFGNLALKYRDILFLVVDVDEVKGVKDKMDVKAMPTFLLMKGNVPVDKIVGANADALQKRVAAFAQMVRQSTADQARAC